MCRAIPVRCAWKLNTAYEWRSGNPRVSRRLERGERCTYSNVINAIRRMRLANDTRRTTTRQHVIVSTYRQPSSCLRHVHQRIRRLENLSCELATFLPKLHSGHIEATYPIGRICGLLVLLCLKIEHDNSPLSTCKHATTRI